MSTAGWPPPLSWPTGGGRLVDLHGQHAHQSLLSAAVQRDLLDRFAGIDLDPLVSSRRQVSAIEARLAGLGGDSGARAREVDLLRFQLDELEGAGLQDPDEDAQLEAEEDDLAAAVERRHAAAVAAAALSADGPVSEAVATARAALDAHPPLAALAERLRTMEAELADIAGEVRAVGELVEERPERLAEIRGRRQLLRRLIRKYGTAVPPGAPGGGAGPPTLADALSYGGDVRRAPR